MDLLQQVAEKDGRPGVIIGVDPSNTATGYAVLTTDGKLVEAGVVSKRGKVIGLAAAREIGRELLAHLRKLVQTPLRVAVEAPARRVYVKRNKGGGAGLALYGQAAGYIFRMLEKIAELLDASSKFFAGGFSSAETPAASRLATAITAIRYCGDPRPAPREKIDRLRKAAEAYTRELFGMSLTDAAVRVTDTAERVEFFNALVDVLPHADPRPATAKPTSVVPVETLKIGPALNEPAAVTADVADAIRNPEWATKKAFRDEGRGPGWNRDRIVPANEPKPPPPPAPPNEPRRL